MTLKIPFPDSECSLSLVECVFLSLSLFYLFSPFTVAGVQVRGAMSFTGSGSQRHGLRERLLRLQARLLVKPNLLSQR